MRATAEIVADLSETADSFARDDWPATAEQIREAADRLTEQDADIDQRILDHADLWKRYDEARAQLAAVNAALDRYEEVRSMGLGLDPAVACVSAIAKAVRR